MKPDAKCVRECVKAGSQWALVEGAAFMCSAMPKRRMLLPDRR